MTRDETKKILFIMTTTWANYRPTVNSAFIDVWHEMLGDMDYSLVAAALKAYAQTDRSGFAPSVGQLRAKAMDLISEEELTEGEAWNLVVKAVCRSSYYAEEEFEKLPPAVQRAVGGPETLREWAMSEDGLDYVRGSFGRSYSIAKDRERERKQVSPDLLGVIDKLMLKGDSE